METTTAPATEKQIAFAKALLEQRVVPTSVQAKAYEALMSKASASEFISMLTALPRKVGSGRPASTTTPVVAPAPMRELAEGFYTVADGEGGHVTFRVSRANWADGQLALGVLMGSDNERSYKDVAFITPNGFRFFRAHRDNQRVIACAELLFTGSVADARAEFMNQAEAYAIASNHCLCCLRRLTVPASVNRGLGPVCAERYGYGI